MQQDGKLIGIISTSGTEGTYQHAGVVEPQTGGLPAKISGAGLHAAGLRQVWAGTVIKEQALQELASVDPLTGLLNRRSFMELLTGSIRDNRRSSPARCSSLDIDHFKAESTIRASGG